MIYKTKIKEKIGFAILLFVSSIFLPLKGRVVKTGVFVDIEADFQKTFTMLEALEDKTYTVDSKVDVIDSKIDSLDVSGSSGSCPCAQTPLTTSDISSGLIILSESKNYCLAEDLTATVSITAHNVCLDLNCRELTGLIHIDAQHVTVKNGKVHAPTPVDNEDATQPAIEITGLSECIEIIHCCVLCDNTSSAENNSNGRSGIKNKARHVRISDCFVQAGTSGLTNDYVTTITGGHAIINYADYVQIIKCHIHAGDGGTLNKNSSFSSYSVADGGVGIINRDANQVSIIGCHINGGNGGSAISTGNTKIKDVLCGGGGNGIWSTGTNLQVIDCSIMAGHGGKIKAYRIHAEQNKTETGLGGSGISSMGDNLRVINCEIVSGNGGETEATYGINASGGYSLITGSGGRGIESTGNNIQAIKSIIKAGSGGSIKIIGENETVNYIISQSAANIITGQGGIGIQSFGNGVQVKTCNITAGIGGNTSSPMVWVNENDSCIKIGQGGKGIDSSGNEVQIIESTVTGGYSGSINTNFFKQEYASQENPNEVEVGEGGCGINSLGNDVCVIQSRIEAGYSGHIILNGTIHSEDSMTLNSGYVKILAGGTGLNSNGNNVQIIKCTIAAGKSGYVKVNKFESSGNLFINGHLEIHQGGDGIYSSKGNDIKIIESIISANDSSDIDVYGSISIDEYASITVMPGGCGINIANGESPAIIKCNVHSGASGSIKSFGAAYGLPVDFMNAGAGILTTNIIQGIILDTIITTTHGGGDKTLMQNMTNITSGNGGNGIHCIDTHKIHIQHCIIDRTGNGGYSPKYGDGGHGIVIETSCSHIEASNCTIANTGSKGANLENFGTDGMAINDLSNSSVIYSNFAHDIANSTKYILGASAAIDQPNGTAFATSGSNYLENVYK